MIKTQAKMRFACFWALLGMIALLPSSMSAQLQPQKTVRTLGKTGVLGGAPRARARTAPAAAQLPFELQPTAEEFDSQCIVVDANNDGATWDYDNGEGAMRYYYSSANDADDWVFLPAIDFGNGGSFDFSLLAKVADRNTPESFEVCVGTSPTPQAMTSQARFEEIDINVFISYEGKLYVPQGGVAYVGIHAISPRDRWLLHVRDISISKGEDHSPAQALLSATASGTEATLTITLPTTDASGSELTLPVGASIEVDGAVVRRLEPSQNKQHTVVLEIPVGLHSVSVTPFIVVDGEEVTGPKTTIDLMIGGQEGYVYPLPMTMQPTRGEFETLLTFYDADGDGICWEYNDNNGSARVRHGESGGGDDWLFFPPFEVTDPSRLIDVSINVRAYMERYPESVELYVGRTADPNSMQKIASLPNVTSYIYVPLAGEFTPAQAGSYVVGVRCNTLSGGHTVNVQSLNVAESAMTTASPAAVSDIVTIPAPDGSLTATVEMTLPTLTISGNQLPSGDILTATVTSPAGSTTVTGNPGQRVSCVVNTRDGYNELTISISSATYGSGRDAVAGVKCGLDLPSAPTVTASVNENNLSLTITWEDSPSGINGGPIGTEPLSHNIFIADEEGIFWEDLATIPAGQNSYTYTVRGDMIQQAVVLGISAVNSKGESAKTAVTEILGTPYPLPLEDSFSAGGYMYSPIVIYMPDETCGTNWGFSYPMNYLSGITDKYTALSYVRGKDDEAAYALLGLPKVATAGTNASISLSLVTSPQSPEVSIYGSSADAPDVLIGTIPAGGSVELKDFTFSIPQQLMGKAWVAIKIKPEFGEGSNYLFITRYGITNNFNREAAVTLSGPAETVVGNNAIFRVSVEQTGSQNINVPEPKLTVTFLDSEETAKTLIPTLDNGSYRFELPVITEYIGKAEVKAYLPEFVDDYPANNEAVMMVDFSTGGLPIVTDLRGEYPDEFDLNLLWTIPEFSETVTEDFERYDSFTYSENIGLWANLDQDGKEVYGIGFSIPGEYLPKAFQVYDADAIGANTSIQPYSGSKCLMVVTPSDASAADDWFISPAVKGGSSLSFMMNILSENYGAEYIDVMYTSGEDRLNLIEYQLIQTYSKGQNTWTKISCDLPADARYFAFRYRTDDVFGLLLDDIVYSPADRFEPEGFRIICNKGEQIPDLPYTANEYFVGNSRRSGEFKIHVLHSGGQLYPASNVFHDFRMGVETNLVADAAVIGKTGHISITGLEGQTVTVATLGGTILREVTATADLRIDLPAGIYLVTSAAHTWKVLVR